MANTQLDIERVCNQIKNLLLEKNRKYGDSALEPVRVMSSANAVEQLLVRIDDKLSRIQRGAGLIANDEDVIQDLIGYFVLLKIAVERDNQNAFLDAAEANVETEKFFLTEDVYSSVCSANEADFLWDPTTGPIEPPEDCIQAAQPVELETQDDISFDPPLYENPYS